MTLGAKLQALRKEAGLSQEVLAEEVAVTRQTISKWELDQSTPDLEYIAQLSRKFGVSTDYLIRDELTRPDQLPFQKRRRLPSLRGRQALFLFLTAAALAACLVCLICDYFSASGLSWSWIALVSIAAAWCVLLPLLSAQEHILLKTLLAVSLVPFPLLAVVAAVLGSPVVFTLGSEIALVSGAALWVIYGIFRRCRRRVWLGLGLSLMVCCIPLPLVILFLVTRAFPQAGVDLTSSWFNSAVTLLLSLGCFAADFWRRRGGREA